MVEYEVKRDNDSHWAIPRPGSDAQNETEREYPLENTIQLKLIHFMNFSSLGWNFMFGRTLRTWMFIPHSFPIFHQIPESSPGSSLIKSSVFWIWLISFQNLFKISSFSIKLTLWMQEQPYKTISFPMTINLKMVITAEDTVSATETWNTCYGHGKYNHTKDFCYYYSVLSPQ